jgi:hypothetical protein
VPDGELRRPPQLWEQRLARMTSVLAAGVSSGDATAIVSPTPPPGTDGGVEPAPVLPPPGDFIAPSQPTLIGSVQGINVVWNGLNSAGDLWPSDTSYVEVHMDTSGPTFTLGTATLKGRLARPGGLAVTGLSRNTTYYFRLRGADPAGNVTDASTAASAQPGQISAPDIAANAITANSIVAGTITGWSINSAYLSGGTVSGGYITGGTISGGLISGGTVTGASVTTSAFNPRVALNDGGGRAAYLDIFSSNNAQHSIYGNLGDLVISPSSRLKVGTSVQIEGDLSFVGGGNGDITATSLSAGGTVTASSVRPTADVIVFQGYRQSTLGTATNQPATDVIMRLNADHGTENQAKFEVEANGDVLSRTNSYGGFSDARQKENITLARNYLDDLRSVDVVTFNWPNDPQKLLGVTAQQIQPIFPSMVDASEDGTLSVKYSVFVPMLITAVQSLADKVDDLTARIEALEA